MGQAKRRGTLAQRKAMAIERNKILELSALPNGSSSMRRFQQRHGIQRMATALVAMGVLPRLNTGGKP